MRGYQAADLVGCRLVIAATDDPGLNAQVSADAQALSLPVNVVDAPALCTVIFRRSSTVRRWWLRCPVAVMLRCWRV